MTSNDRTIQDLLAKAALGKEALNVELVIHRQPSGRLVVYAQEELDGQQAAELVESLLDAKVELLTEETEELTLHPKPDSNGAGGQPRAYNMHKIATEVDRWPESGEVAFLLRDSNVQVVLEIADR